MVKYLLFKIMTKLNENIYSLILPLSLIMLIFTYCDDIVDENSRFHFHTLPSKNTYTSNNIALIRQHELHILPASQRPLLAHSGPLAQLAYPLRARCNAGASLYCYTRHLGTINTTQAL